MQLTKISYVLIVCLALLAGCASWIAPKVKPGIIALKPGQYSLDPAHASLVFKVDHMGLSSYVGRFNQFDARLDFAEEDVSKARLEAKIIMASVDVNNSDLEETLRGKSWFNSEEYPEAYFKTLSAKPIDASKAIFSGELTFLGITQPLDITVNFRGGALNPLTGKYTVGYSAHTTFLRSAFGMNNYIPLVGDEITIDVHAEFQK